MRFLLVFLFCAPGLLLAQPAVEILKVARQDIAKLCADDFHGRGYQQKGHTLAAEYIAGRYQAAGLKPFPDAPGYLQPFTFLTNRVDSAHLQVPGGDLRLGVDYIPAPYTGSGHASGDFFHAPTGLPQDYNGRSIKGMVVFIGNEKAGTEGVPAKYTTEEGKAYLAQQLGAAGVVFLQPKLTFAYSPQQLDIPVLYLLEDNLTSIIAASPYARPSATVAAQAQLGAISTQNVVGYFPGTASDEKAVVISAHYDHLGRVSSPDTSVAFVGANDNGAGTAFLLSLLDHYAANPPKHPVVFLAAGAEEAGLHGSRYYVQGQPLYPLEKTTLNLNFDLLGYGSEGVMVLAGETYPAHYAELNAVKDSLGLQFAFKKRPNRANSDHYWFTEAGITGLFFYAMGGKTHYHDIYDRPKELTLEVFPDLRRVILAYLNRTMAK